MNTKRVTAGLGNIPTFMRDISMLGEIRAKIGEENIRNRHFCGKGVEYKS
jgi:hypothetical protein